MCKSWKRCACTGTGEPRSRFNPLRGSVIVPDVLQQQIARFIMSYCNQYCELLELDRCASQQCLQDMQAVCTHKENTSLYEQACVGADTHNETLNLPKHGIGAHPLI